MNVHEFSVAILTTNENKKTPTAIAREAGRSQSTGSRLLTGLSTASPDFISTVKIFYGNKPINFATDDFCVSRRYAKNTEAVSSMKDPSTKTFTTGTSLVAGGFTDGTYFIPVDFEHWITEFIMKDQYLTKPQLAMKIVQRMINSGINIKHFVYDGLYFNQEFIEFLDDKNVDFVMKAKTTTSVNYKNKQIQLRNCPELRLNDNQNCKKIRAWWNDRLWYFIALRRSGKHGEKIIYLIANFYAKTKIYGQTYDSRWTVEKFIRTGKQSLGLSSSQSKYANTYLNHFRCVFWAYTLLQFIMKKFKLKSAEDALRKVQALKSRLSFNQIVDSISLMVTYA
jgi:hypothetical protein